ncbi:MAG: NADP-dependent phosphogluconate dehydrogenase [Candidatus Promineifilaceae bacterium]
MSDFQCEIGLIGLGTMGENFLLNMADHGYAVAGYNRTKDKVDHLIAEAGDRAIRGAKTVEELIGMLKRPRRIVLLVPAGGPVDSVIGQLLPLLEEGDIIIDGGNSHFTDTERREKELAEKNIHFIGMGVSGGAEGARFGPSMMPGGKEDAYNEVKEIFEAASAKVNGDPCITYLGPRSAGHYVKMVHNGIEYGIMQLLSECYDLMKNGLGLTNPELHQVFNEWNQAELSGFLVEITAEIFTQKDDKGDGWLIDKILDTAKQKGTGKWTSEDAFNLGVPIPSIDIAVTGRYLSALKMERKTAAEILSHPAVEFNGNKEEAISQLRNSLYTAMIITYAQGMTLLQAASAEYDYNLDLESVARIWRGGCIIRSVLLEDFRKAYRARPDLPNLLLDPHLAAAVKEREQDLRMTVKRTVGLGIPAPGFAVALGYLDSYRRQRLPANLIQAQRDYFGSHTYQRIDMDGIFHTEWGKE